MSIAAQLERIQNAVNSSYEECAKKGATIPEAKKIANLPACIESIPSGGGGGSASITSDNTMTFSRSVAHGTNGNDGIQRTFSDGQSIFVPITDALYEFSETINLSGNVKIVSVHWYTGCLFTGTKIKMYDGSYKNIEDIELNDKVYSYDPIKKCFCEDIVTYCDGNLDKTSSNGYDLWKFSDGYEVKTVNPHRFYNVEKQCMVYMSEWKIGDHAYTLDNKKVELIDHIHVDGTFKHYTIFTKNQNYFANGLLSGNRNTKEINLGR